LAKLADSNCCDEVLQVDNFLGFWIYRIRCVVFQMGKTALMYAVDGNYSDIVAVLLEHNADISIIDKVFCCVFTLLLKGMFISILPKSIIHCRWDTTYSITVDSRQLEKC
jgi:ankyrin repeat protein